MLLIPIFLRSYVIFRFFISMSSFYDHRSARISYLIFKLRQLFGIEISRLFTFKCMMVEYPLRFMLFSSLFLTVINSYCLRILEYAPAVDDQGNVTYNHKSFEYITSALWYIFITYLTVGYGDLNPITNPGRLLAIFTVFSGTVMTSVLIVTIQGRLEMNGVEANVYL
jgi:hypothetical protein